MASLSAVSRQSHNDQEVRGFIICDALYATRGVAGGASASNGADAGGAIFSLTNSLEVIDSTFSGNQSTGSGAAIVVYSDTGPGGGLRGGSAPVNFTLYNTIIANNGARMLLHRQHGCQRCGQLDHEQWFRDRDILTLSWSGN
jgi:hypothetical protein